MTNAPLLMLSLPDFPRLSHLAAGSAPSISSSAEFWEFAPRWMWTLFDMSIAAAGMSILGSPALSAVEVVAVVVSRVVRLALSHLRAFPDCVCVWYVET